MRVGDIIDYVDGVEPNQFDAQIKIDWLADLDNKVYTDVISTHENPIVEEDWKAPEKVDDELLIPAPYARDCYEYYLRAKIAASNLEDVRYNQHLIMYNNAYNEFFRYYNRTHRALPAKGGNIFRY